MYNNNNNNVTPGVAFANGMQQTAMLGMAQNQAQSNYNQGYNQGVKEAWEIANKQIAELTKERDVAQADLDKTIFVAQARRAVMRKLKGEEWEVKWREALEPEAIKIYQAPLLKKGYTINK